MRDYIVSPSQQNDENASLLHGSVNTIPAPPVALDKSAGKQMTMFVIGLFVIIAALAFVVLYSNRLILIVTAGLAFIGYLFSLLFARWVLTVDVHVTPRMQEVAQAVRDGAGGFLKTQFRMIMWMAIVVCAIVVGIYYAKPLAPENDKVNTQIVPLFTGVCFIFGATCSGIAGYIGMWVSVRSNIRVAGAARAENGYSDAIKVAMFGGVSSGLLVVGMVVIGLSTIYTAAHELFPSLDQSQIASHIVGFGFGASLVALFAQLGGGIYTKAADVGADIVGKIDSNIPEDDPRNPAVIADLVGDNVGDCAGRGADLFESISAEIIGAMILGGKLAMNNGLGDDSQFVFFPLLVHSFDLIVSSLGALFVRNWGKKRENPLWILSRGFIISLFLAGGGFTIACKWLLHTDKFPDAWWKFLLCGVVGMFLALMFLLLTEYYTGTECSPVHRIAQSSTTGHGTNVITGLSVGMESTGIPAILIAGGIMGSYFLGNWAMPGGGLFGTAVATMGMLSIAAFVLGMDTFGPITDNAGGIIEMSGEPEHVREITDRLDAVGNTTKALTKGWAIGSAGLAAFLLFNAFVDVVDEYADKPLGAIDFSRPEVFSAGLVGAALVIVFSALAMRAVGHAAGQVVVEVRRQFTLYPGILSGQQKPNYSECVSLIHKASLREMLLPGLLAVFATPIVGVTYRYIGYSYDSILAPTALAAFLMIATTTGIVMALFLNNAGGSWDNAKKLIEQGNFGGKGSEAHKAAVTGDCVGDPCKDTAGPSIHVLIKMLSTITLVLGPVFL